ncbi:thioredoxin domain-containing protein [Legionella fallonii]|nr:membrane protein [Legionella fallonii]
MRVAFRYLVIIFLFTTSLWANNSSSLWYTKDAGNKIILNVELFLSSTCPHCHKADAFFKETETTTPWLHVNRYIIDKDKNALVRFNQLLNDQQMSDFAVPSIFFCNSRWVGFATAETTGKDLLHALNYCKQQIEEKGELTSTNIGVLRRWANANLFDSGMIEHPTAGKYLTVVALMDAFNPCALFSIGGFFALLFMQDSRKRQIISGSLYILAIGLVHFTQQTFTNAFYEWLPWFRWPAAIIGLFAFYLAGQYYRKKTAPKLFYLLALLLGFVTQAYQQTCLMNWSYIFQQWLYNQHISSIRTGLYQFAYQMMYLAPLILMLILYVSLIKMKRLANWEQRLQPVGLLYIMAAALFLIIYPPVLSNLLMSLFVLLCVIIAGLFLSKFRAS